MNGESRLYVKMRRVSGNASRGGITLTSDENEATPITITKTNTGNTFYFSATISGTTFYWNRNEKSPGAGAFVGYASSTDKNTARIALEYERISQDDPYELDGKSYSLMNYGSGISAIDLTDALITKNDTTRLGAKQMLIRNDPMDQSRTLFISKDADLAVWTFQNIAEDRYYISCGGKYLSIGGANISLVDSPDDNCVIRPVPGEGRRAGKVRLFGVAANRAVSFSGNVNDGFTLAAPSDNNNQWFNFVQPSVYGDDDFWLYVDGELIIDLGGIHSAVGASVNYSTGKVTVNKTKTTLYDLFKSNYEQRNPTAGESEVNAYLDSIFVSKSVTVGNTVETQYIFKDYSYHTVRIFYMERGAGASNLRMRFNLASVTPGQVTLSKEISGTDKQDFASVRFPFQIFHDDGLGGGYQLSTPVEETLFTIGTDGIVTVASRTGYIGTLSQSGDERIDYTLRIPVGKQNLPLAPTGYTANTEPFVWLLVISSLLMAACVAFRLHLRRDEEN